MKTPCYCHGLMAGVWAYHTVGECGPADPGPRKWVAPAPSPPLPEVGSECRGKVATDVVTTVLAVTSCFVKLKDWGSYDHADFHEKWEPIPPAPAAEPVITFDVRLDPVTKEPLFYPRLEPPRPSCLCAPDPLTGEDIPGHWDARCPSFEAEQPEPECDCPGGSPLHVRAACPNLRYLAKLRPSCVCLSRDCGECGPKLERERLIAIAGSPWGGLMAWLPEKP